MKKVTIKDNSILFSRKGELVRISACGENAIRFQGFPDGKVIDEDYNLTSATTNVTYTFGEQMTKAGLNTLMGMGTVFVVLILIALLISAFNLIPKVQAIFAKKEKKAETAVNNAVAQIVENEAVQEEDDLELIAVIAAAIAASEGAASTDGYVVRSIRRIR